MSAYYNEHDPRAAAWLRALIAAGEIAPGDVDERSIVDVRADDLVGYRQCHFFAGIGGWSLALRLAGVADDDPVWTGSCPCQPFSSAGKGGGTADERHLWPELARLIGECRPPIVVGEQVASRLGRDWLGAVRADLEALGYGVGAADLCAAGVGAPHIRQRLWWGGIRLADAGCVDRPRWRTSGDVACTPGDSGGEAREQRVRTPAGDGGANGGLADPASERRRQGREDARGGARGVVASASGAGSTDDDGTSRLDHSDSRGLKGLALGDIDGAGDRLDALRSGLDAWTVAGWVLCADGRTRPLAPVARRVDHGVPARVGLLRGYGNAIVPQVGAAFVRAFFDAAGEVA